MLKTLLFIISALTSALICGFSLITAVAAALALCAAGWFNTLIVMRTQTWYVVNDPACYTPRLVGQALEEAEAASISSGRSLMLHISNPGLNRIEVGIAPGGQLRVSDSRGSVTLASRGSWIPDHPLPLILPAGERSTLSFTPLADQRVRVSTHPPPRTHPLLYLLLAPLILLAVLSTAAAAAALAAVLLHTVLQQRFAES